MSWERDNIRRLEGYTSGEQPDDTDTIKLNTNENPWPPSPAVDAVLQSMDGEALRRYPPPTADAFRDLAARYHGIQRDNLIATRGGDELLRLVITTFVEPGQPIAMTDPTYSLYPVLAQIHDCPVVKVPLESDWSLDPAFIDTVVASGARLTLLVNPHAPSGQLVDVAQLREIAGALEGLLLIDEAYVDFIDPAIEYDSLGLLGEFDNVIILRTLSKGYSLAGLRFGYGIGAVGLIRPMLEKTRDSYNLDLVSQRIAEAALTDVAHARETWKKVREERERLGRSLRGLGFDVSPSHSNFLLARTPGGQSGAESLYRALKDRGILVRYFNEPRLVDKLRISVGTPDENDRLIAALEVLV